MINSVCPLPIHIHPKITIVIHVANALPWGHLWLMKQPEIPIAQPGVGGAHKATAMRLLVSHQPPASKFS